MPTTLHNLQNVYKCMTSRHQKSAVSRICLLSPSMGEISLKSISFMKNQYCYLLTFMKINTCPRGRKTQLLKSKLCDFQDLLSLPLNTQNSKLSHALQVAGR